MNDKVVTLKWSSILPFSKLDVIPDKATGIYIWGFNPNKSFIPYYVGKAVNIKKRLRDHMISLCGGGYNIHNKKYLKEFYKAKLKGSDPKRVIHSPNNPVDEIEFIKNRNRTYKAHIDEMVDNFNFSYATITPISNSKVRNNTLINLEKTIIRMIGIDKLWNKRGGKEVNIKVINKGDKIILDLLN